MNWPLAATFLASLAAAAAGLTLPLSWTIAAITAVTAAAITFVRPKAGLGLLIFSMLLSPELGLGHAGSRPIAIRGDDILLVMIFLAWMAHTTLKKDMTFLRTTPAHRPIFLYMALFAVSTGIGILRGDILPLKGFFYVAKYSQYFFVFFLAVNLTDSRQDVQRALRYAAITALLVTLYAYQYHYRTGDRTTAPFDDALYGIRDASEPGTLGGYYIVVFGTIMGLATELPTGALLAAVGLLLFMFPAFLLTLSRASYAGMGVCVFSVFCLARRRKFAIACAACLACGLALCNPAIRQDTAARIDVTFHGDKTRQLHNVNLLGYDVQLEDSAAQRVWAWDRILNRKFPQHPLLGHGATGIGFEDTQYGSILGEFGLLGLLIFGWLTASVAGMGLHALHAAQQPLERGLAIGLVSVLAGLLTHAFTANTFIIIKIMEPFWLLAALVAAISRINSTPDGALT